MTKTVIFLTKQLGENSDTSQDIVDVWRGLNSVDLSEQVMCCLNSGDDRLVPTWRYGFRLVDLPDWLSAEEYQRHDVEWSYAWARGVDVDWPETWQRALMRMPDRGERIALIDLLRVKAFRSEFRRSLRFQVEAWLDTPVEERRFETPLSPRQLSSITTDEHVRRARQRVSMAGRAWHGAAWDQAPVAPVLNVQSVFE